jgi:diguanylate cyclase (GGDEF)-like protein
MEQRRFKSRYGRTAVVRGAIIVFLLAAVVIGGVTFLLDRSARRSNATEASTQLASAARVAATSIATLRANLGTGAATLATSESLQLAVLEHRLPAVARIAGTHRAQIQVGRHLIGRLPAGPRIVASANIVDHGRRLARVTEVVPLDASMLSVLEQTTPLPTHASLVFVHGGRLVGGGAATQVVLTAGRMHAAGTSFFAQRVPVYGSGASVVAVEPTAAVEAKVLPYRRRLIAIALITLALAAAFSARLARPVARVLGDLARLAHQASTDALTGVANRRTLDERLDEEVDHARRINANVSFVIADIDNFKSINDRFGHQTGDEALRRVAATFAESVRQLDVVGRYGGEEFGVVLPGTNLSGARRLADKVREAIEAIELYAPDGERVPLTASFGAATFPTYPDVETLVAAADGSLYEAKRNGKNRVVTATARRRPAPALGSAQ